MPQVNRVERQVRRADRFQQRHAGLAFPWAVAQKFGNDQAGGKAALMACYGLFALFPCSCCWPPSSGSASPLTQADRLVFLRLAQMEVRRPEGNVIASFAEAAGEDPLDDLGDEA